MRIKHSSIALPIAAALGITLGSAARADTTGAESAPAAAPVGQARVAGATRNLEKVFDEQFAQGTIDRGALAAPIADVVQAMPEPARPKVQAHIEQVLQTAEKLVSQMSPEERATVTQPPPAEKVASSAQALVNAWGWPYLGGWGGYGAFGFPAMYTYGFGLPYYGTAFPYYATAVPYYGLGCGTGVCGAGLWGGLGRGGWYW